MLTRVIIAAGMIPLYLADASAQGPVGTSVLSGMVVDDASKPEPSAQVGCQKLNGEGEGVSLERALGENDQSGRRLCHFGEYWG